MNIKKYIQNLRSKPEADRKRAATTATVACMIVVGTIWAYGLTSHLAGGEVKAQAKTDAKPFAMLANSIKDTYQNISASVNEAKSVSGAMKSEKEDAVAPESDVMIDLIPVEPQQQ